MAGGVERKRSQERRKSPRYAPEDACATVIVGDREFSCVDWGATGFRTTIAAGTSLTVGDRFSGSLRIEGAQPIRFVARIVYVDGAKQQFGAAFVDPDHTIERALEKLDPFWQPPPTVA